VGTVSGVHLTVSGHVAEIRLDNPARLNAFTVGMLGELAAHCDAIERRDDLRAVLVTAEGARAFCAGADINAWGDLPPAEFARTWVRDGHRVFDRLARLAVRTIAVLEGPAFGGGLELAAACDIRVMVPTATLALPEASVGIVPGWSGTQRLARLLPEAVLKEMALFGRRLTAERAHQIGFVAEVAEDARGVALAMAEQLAATSPRATEVAKYMIHAGAGEDSAALIEALGGGMMAASGDKAEGVAAFRAKRKPEFSGN
jgi:enoyl-CoA hydratase